MDLTSAEYMFGDCDNLISIDTSCFTRITNAHGMFNSCSELKTINTSGLINVSDARSMFRSCSELTIIDTSVFSNITNASYMFRGCVSLTTINRWGFNLDNLTEFNQMFRDTNITEIYCKDMIVPNPYKGESFNDYYDIQIFFRNNFSEESFYNNLEIYDGDVSYESPIITPCQYCPDLMQQLPLNTPENPYPIYMTEVSKEDCENNNMRFYINECYNKYISLSFESLPSDLINADNMFLNCSNLVSIDTSQFTNITSAKNMFGYCESLKTIDLSPFTKLKNASNMCFFCQKLEEVNCNGLFNVENTKGMFNYMESLKRITWGFDVGKLYQSGSTWNYMFEHNSSFKEVVIPNTTIATPYDGSPIFNRDSVIQYLGNIYYQLDVIGGELTIPSKIFTPFIYLNTILATVPENDIDTPYDIEITEITKDEMKGWYHAHEGELQRVLLDNNTKFLNLSFTTVPSGVRGEYLFTEVKTLVSVNASKFGEITNAHGMFRECDSLKHVYEPNFSSIEDTRDMFTYCGNLIDIDLSTLKNVKTTSSMFSYCSNLTEIFGWNIPLNAVDGSTIIECPESLVVHVKKPTIKDTDEFSLVRLRMNRTSTQITVQGLTETESHTSTLATTKGSQIIFDAKSDEITFGSVSEDEFASMIRHPFIWNYRSKSLNPDNKNFVLWATEGSNVITNIGGGGGGGDMTEDTVKLLAVKYSGALGELRYFPNTDYQFGFLFCDGSIFLKEVYPEFFTFWKTHFEKKCGYDRFGNPRLPDFRGKYIRGSNEGDIPYEFENEALPNIRGDFGNWNQWTGSRFANGAFTARNDGTWRGFQTSGDDSRTAIAMSAHKWNPIYGSKEGFNADKTEHVIVNNINSNIYIKVI